MDFSNLKEFHCSICDKLFDSEERCPKMLSCGHSFCLTCLDKIFPDCPSCPICKTYIQFSSVDLIPVNLLIRNCVAKINVQSGVKRKDFAELNGAENNSSIERDAKRQKLASVGYCDKHENFNELRCMNCEIWICSMCAILNHKKCDTLLVEEAFKEVQKKSDQIIDNLLDIKKSRLVKVYNSSKALEEKNKSLKLDIVDLKLKIESKLNEIKENDIELDSLRDKIVDEKEISLNLKEIQLLTKTSFSIKNLKELMEAKTKLDTLFQEQVKSPEGYEIETESIEYIEESSDLEKFILQSEDGEVVSESKDADFVPSKMDNSDFGIAQADFWSQGRVLIAGDSRVRHLQDVPDPLLSDNVDFAFEGGILIDDLVALVDRKLSDEHTVIILLGFVSDQLQKYSHNVTDDSSVTLIRSKESDPSAQIMVAVQTAHAKWMALKTDRIIVWTIPYFLDYATYNAGKLGEFDAGDTLAVSWDSSRQFVNFITRLKLQFETASPNLTFCLLNRVLFPGRSYKVLYKSFGAISGADFRFPTQFLTDGLHPTAKFAKSIWTYLHKSVSLSHGRQVTGKQVISPPSTSQGATSSGIRNSIKTRANRRGYYQGNKKPYVYKKNLTYIRKNL